MRGALVTTGVARHALSSWARELRRDRAASMIHPARQPVPVRIRRVQRRGQDASVARRLHAGRWFIHSQAVAGTGGRALAAMLPNRRRCTSSRVPARCRARLDLLKALSAADRG